MPFIPTALYARKNSAAAAELHGQAQTPASRPSTKQVEEQQGGQDPLNSAGLIEQGDTHARGS
jgi:hypothetical protein